VSRDNPSGTARNLRRYLEAAASRNGHRSVELRALDRPRPRCPQSRTAPNGDCRRSRNASRPACETAGRAGLHLGGPGGGRAERLSKRRPDVSVITMPHPSPANVCTSPDVSQRIERAARRQDRTHRMILERDWNDIINALE
jgi:hypothetical protein